MALTTNPYLAHPFNPKHDHEGDDEDPDGYRKLLIPIGRNHYQDNMKIPDSEEDRTGNVDSDDDVQHDRSGKWGPTLRCPIY